MTDTERESTIICFLAFWLVATFCCGWEMFLSIGALYAVLLGIAAIVCKLKGEI